MPQYLTKDKSSLVQVMACCPMAASHYLKQCCRAWLFSKSSLARLQEFWNSLICLYEIKRNNLFKSTCRTGSFTWPRPLGSGKWRTLHWPMSMMAYDITRSQWAKYDIAHVIPTDGKIDYTLYSQKTYYTSPFTDNPFSVKLKLPITFLQKNICLTSKWISTMGRNAS